MAESLVQVTEGVGKKLHTWARVVGANTVEDDFSLPGEFPLPSYTIDPLGLLSTATANDHLLQIMAGASLNVRLRRIEVYQGASATAATIETLLLVRLTTAGTGGTALTPAKLDTNDVAAGATAMTLPTAKGTEGVEIYRRPLTFRQALATTQSQADPVWSWYQLPNSKPIIIPAGAANGIALKHTGAVAGASVIVYAEFVETSYL